MPRTGHYKVDDLKNTSPAAYSLICALTKDNASLEEIVYQVKDRFDIVISKNAVYNWRTKKYLRELQAQQMAVELTNLLDGAIKNQDPEEAREKIIRGMLENLALQVLNNNKLTPENVINAVAVFRRLDNEKLKIQAEAKKHEVELAKLELAKVTAEKQSKFYELKIQEIQKAAKDDGQISESKLNNILHGYLGIDGQDKKADKKA